MSEPPASSGGGPTPPAEPGPPAELGRVPVGTRVRDALLSGNAATSVLALILAFAVGGVLIAVADPEVQDAAGYFFARPSDLLVAIWESVGGAYIALFEGAIFSPGTDAPLGSISETLVYATPLILTGLAVTVAFRAGLFNIGAEGQLIAGAICAAYVGFAVDLPPVVHVTAGVVAGMLGGALWAGIVGFLKARTGAHEVITTIMLNHIALHLVAFGLATSLFRDPDQTNPISPRIVGDAVLPKLLSGLDSSYRVHLGLVLAVLAAVVIWWLLYRTTLGFQIRAAGANRAAARTAGMSVGRSYVAVMVVAGSMAGLAGVTQVLGTERVLIPDISANLGFDGITVALLGRGSPWGTVLAGLLFGALRAGAVTMQSRTGAPLDIVLVIQALIVLFIAAPPLIRAVFRIKARGATSIGQVSKGWSS